MRFIEERINEIEVKSRKKGFINQSFFHKKLFTFNKTSLSLNISPYALMRGELFCTDIVKLAEEEINAFTIDHLILLLYLDFLQMVRKSSLTSIYNTLMRLKSKYQFEIVTFSKSGTMSYTREDNIYPRKNKIVQYKILIKKEYVLRGQVLIYEIEEEFPDFEMSIEELFSLLYRDFIENIKNGISKEIIQSIIKSI